MIKHKDYQIHLNPKEIVRDLGKTIYDKDNQVYVPENEETNLMSLLVPIHKEKLKKEKKNVKEDTKPLVFDEEGQRLRRENTKRQTAKLDE